MHQGEFLVTCWSLQPRMSTFRNSDLFKTPSVPSIKGEMSILSRSMEQNNIYDLVQDRYGQLASESKGTHENVARAFGYEASELNSIPKDATLGVSCGNPLVLASLREVSFWSRKMWSCGRTNWRLAFKGRNCHRPRQWWRYRCLTSSQKGWTNWKSDWRGHDEGAFHKTGYSIINNTQMLFLTEYAGIGSEKRP